MRAGSPRGALPHTSHLHPPPSCPKRPQSGSIVAMTQTIIIKLGTSVLTSGTRKIDRRRILELTRQAVALREAGHRVIIVSSGAIAAGRELLNYPTFEKDRLVSAKQMLAAVGQGRLIQIYSDLFAIFGVPVGQVLLTRGDLANRTGYLNARETFLTLLEHRVVPIVNENDTIATEEIKVGDNDNLSALVANLIDADLLILLTDQQGLYDSDPRRHPAAKLISRVERLDESVFALAGGSSTGLGTGGMITKLQAAQLAGRSGTTTVIAAGALPDVLTQIVAGQTIGTTIMPAIPHRESRKRYILAEKAQGFLYIDAGASARLRVGGASLLPVGLTRVEGEFERGAPVQIAGPEGPLAAGLANYASNEARQLIGVKSAAIEGLLGYSYGDEIVHRDNLTLFEGHPPA
jgi:glutamate 5-kinase